MSLVQRIIIRTDAFNAMRYFPNTDVKTARWQAFRLLKAKQYLSTRHIDVNDPSSCHAFEYKKPAGMFGART